MPRAPKQPKSEDDDTKPYASPTKTPPASPKKTLNIKKWSYDDKLDILKDILETAVPDWEKIAQKHEGRTANMAKDQWRKTLFPALMKTGSIVGSAGKAGD